MIAAEKEREPLAGEREEDPSIRQLAEILARLWVRQSVNYSEENHARNGYYRSDENGGFGSGSGVVDSVVAFGNVSDGGNM